MPRSAGVGNGHSRREAGMRQRSCVSGLFGLFAILGVALAGCESSKPAAVEAPAPTVTVSKPVSDTITDAEEFTGRTEAVDSVAIRARVSGYLDKVNFSARSALPCSAARLA